MALAKDRTTAAVQSQLSAFPEVAKFELTALKQAGLNTDGEKKAPHALVKTMSSREIVDSIERLKDLNGDGYDLNIRPAWPHAYTMLDDVSRAQIERMKATGFAPSAVIETSPGNYHVWVRHHEPLQSQILGTRVAKDLAAQFGGDPAAANWRHLSRLAGFDNRKEKHRDAKTGLYYPVTLREWGGKVYANSPEYIPRVQSALAAEEAKAQKDLQRYREMKPAFSSPIPIERFYENPKFRGDASSADIAYAIHATSRNYPPDLIKAEIKNWRGQDLEAKHPGEVESYLSRTVRAAERYVSQRGHRQEVQQTGFSAGLR